MKLFDAQRFSEVASRVFHSTGADQNSVSHVVNASVETSLRGIDSHGINLLPHYLRAVKGGRVNPRPQLAVVKKARSSLVLDADHAFGHFASAHAVELGIQLASETGMAAVGVRNSTHFGAAAYGPLRAARAGYVGFGFTNADALVRAFGATRAALGTNPLCMTAPMEAEDPFCLDMATSTITWNKVLRHRAEGTPLNAGWAADESGRGVTDPNQAKMLEPLGGYKGFGLGMMVEILCGLLMGGPAAGELLPMFSAPIEARRRLSHFFMVLDVNAFSDLQTFKTRLSALARELRALGPESMIPGDPEKRAFFKRSKEGIPVTEEKFSEFFAMSGDFAAAVLP